MFICAQLDNDNICRAVSRLKSPIEQPNIIPLSEWREDILGKRYDRETGQFVEVEPSEEGASGD